MIPLFQHNGEIFVLLTKRSEELRSHSGEVCFPGGKFEKNDENILHTAKREAFEEIGLHQSNINVLGFLIPTVTTYNLAIFPVVCYINDLSKVRLKLNRHEVDDVFSCPLKFFLDSPTLAYKNVGKIPQHSFTWVKNADLLKENLNNDFLKQVLCNSKHDKFHIWGLTSLYCIITASLCCNESPGYISDMNDFLQKLKTYFFERISLFSGSKM